VRHHLGE